MLVTDLLTGAAVSLPFAFAAARFGRISTAGAATGVLFGAIAYAAFYLAGMAVLGVALVLTLLSTRLRRRRTSNHQRDARGAANIIANCIVGVIGAGLHLAFDWRQDPSAIWFVTGIAAGASDTVASEIGQAFGGSPRAIPSLTRVAPGTPGAISVVGTVAGAIAAGVIALPAAALWLVPAAIIGPIALACATGSLIESVLAGLLEARGLINNHALNVLNTLAAAGLVALWVSLLSAK